jgi:signal transduction histidine kinase
VSVDAARLRQALTNVLSNAYKYSRGRGEIRMSFPVRTHLGVRWAGILVEDEGIGMTPEQLRRVFDRFYRADRSGAVPGTGLGMPLAKEIMERMNGLIEVTSEAGKGTRVTLWLPASAG